LPKKTLKTLTIIIEIIFKIIIKIIAFTIITFKTADLKVIEISIIETIITIFPIIGSNRISKGIIIAIILMKINGMIII